MSLSAKQGEKTQRPIPPIGAHPAICYSIVDLGTHMKAFQGQDPKPTPLMQISWEFPNLPKQTFDEAKGPQPLAIHQEYTVSLGDKAKLFKVLQAWRGVNPVDLEKELPMFVGQPCLINVIHNQDKQNPNIKYGNIAGNGTGIMRLPQGMQIGQMSNPKMFFNLDQYSHDKFIQLPEWIRKKIQSSLEWSGIVARFGQPNIPQKQDNNPFLNNQQSGGFGGHSQPQNTSFGANQNASFDNSSFSLPDDDGVPF